MFDYLRDELIRLDWRSAVQTYIKSPRSLRFANQTGATIYADSFQMLTHLFLDYVYTILITRIQGLFINEAT